MSSKRFIAGATCPRCQDQDSIFVEVLQGRKYRACVSCDLREEMRFENHPQEPDTRVNRGSADQKIQVIKLVDTPDD